MENIGTSSNRQLLEKRYKNARGNLLIVALFTVINIILLVAKTNVFFLFSAYIPFALVDLGMALCGMYPAEYYGNDFAISETLGSSAFVIFLGIALIPLILYLLSWIFSKNFKFGWLVFALVFFCIDTFLMILLNGINLESVIDIGFHIWVIVSFVMGINAASKLKYLPPEDESIVEMNGNADESVNLHNSGILRIADNDVKHRTLLETDILGHKVVYRRVKRTNELIIDGNIYDEVEALVEWAHSLSANIDGHIIEVGFDGGIHSYAKLDGVIVAKKVRLY